MRRIVAIISVTVLLATGGWAPATAHGDHGHAHGHSHGNGHGPAANDEWPEIDAPDTGIYGALRADAIARLAALAQSAPAKSRSHFQTAVRHLDAADHFFDDDAVIDEKAFDHLERVQKELEHAHKHGNNAARAEVEALQDDLAAIAIVAAWRRFEFLAGVSAMNDEFPEKQHREFVKRIEHAERDQSRDHFHQAVHQAAHAWDRAGAAQRDFWDVVDRDEDLIPLAKELELGLDPDESDTDGDGLSDFNELIDTFTDPTVDNTDGISDADADVDGDGLTAQQELEYGTLVIEADSDLDGLSDGVEVLQTGSDPNSADTDGDGIRDGDEVAVGLDPTVPDSDGDGVVDGAETVASHATLVESTLDVSVVGVGNVAGYATATDESYLESYFADVEGLVMGPYELRAEAEFESATLSFAIPSTIDAPEELVVARYNEEFGAFEPLESTYDPATGSLTATTPHFSTYAVVRWQAWLSYSQRHQTTGGRAMLDTPGCYANQLYRETLGGTWVDLPFSITLDNGTFDRIPLGAAGVMQVNSEPGSTPTSGHSDDLVWTAPRFSPYAASNSVWDITPDGASVTPLTYGMTTFEGRPAFCATWEGMARQVPFSPARVESTYSNPGNGTFYINYVYDEYGYDYSKTNDFQMLIVDRSDTGEGNVDLIFNYDSIQWQTYYHFFSWQETHLSDGTVYSWPYTSSAQAGFTEGMPQQCGDTEVGMEWVGYFDGQADPDSYPESAYPWAYPDGFWFPVGDNNLLDSSETGLAVTSTRSDVPGRHVFPIRQGDGSGACDGSNHGTDPGDGGGDPGDGGEDPGDGGDGGSGETDSDGDGITDAIETRGMVIGTGKIVTTDPNDADSDDDGLLDGDELVSASAPWMPDYYRMVSNPHIADTDGDELLDGDELELGFNPRVRDMDGDGLWDGLEYDAAFDPRRKNADNDGANDLREYQDGTDPFGYDPSGGDKARAFILGAFLGELGYIMATHQENPEDIWFGDQIAYEALKKMACAPVATPGAGAACLAFEYFRPVYVQMVEYVAGQIVVAFIPYVDIVVSVRDIIGAALQGAWVSALIETVCGVVGLVPLIGDVPKIIKASASFIKHADEAIDAAGAVATVVARMDGVPAAVPMGVWKQLDPGTVARLEAKHPGITDAKNDEFFAHILKKNRTTMAALARVLEAADEIRTINKSLKRDPSTPFFDTAAGRVKPGGGRFGRGKEAEHYLHRLLGGTPQEMVIVNGAKRYLDLFVERLGKKTAIEIKSGDGSPNRVQLQRDFELMSANGSKFEVLEYHFFPSVDGGRLGPTPAFLTLWDELKAAYPGVEARFVIHVP